MGALVGCSKWVTEADPGTVAGSVPFVQGSFRDTYPGTLAGYGVLFRVRIFDQTRNFADLSPHFAGIWGFFSGFEAVRKTSNSKDYSLFGFEKGD